MLTRFTLIRTLSSGWASACLLTASVAMGQGYPDPVAQPALEAATMVPTTVVGETLTDAPESSTEPSVISAVAPDCGCEAVTETEVANCGCESCATKRSCGSFLCRERKERKPAKPNPCATSHKGLFYANDFSYLGKDDYCGNCIGDSLKQIPFGQCGKLDIGGQARYRYHSEFGMGRQAGALGFQGTQNDFGLFRLRLFGNYKVNNDIRLFAEGIYADVANADGLYLPRPIDRNRGDFLNLFADIALTEATSVRIGRQELLFGAQRLVSPLDWANTRRTFDGVRTTSKFDDLTFDMFYTQFVPVSFDSFDNPNEDVNFYGAHATYTGMEKATVDMYYFGFNNTANGAPVASNFNVDTFGSRIQGSTANKILYEAEASWQTGVQRGLATPHEAYAATGGLGYQFSNHPWKPTLWGFYDVATGNDPGDTDFNRYNQLFPLAHKYLGFIDAVARANIQSPNVRLTMAPTNKLKLLLWYYNFQAEEAGDIVPGVAVPSAQNTTSDDFGNELDFTASYQLRPRTNVLAGYSHLWAGDKIIGNSDADFFYLQFTQNF